MRSSRKPKQHQRRLVLILVLTALTAGLVTAGPPGRVSGPGCEPRLPLDVTLRVAEGDPAVPGTALALDISAMTDLSAVRLEILLPDQASLLSGPQDNISKLDRGDRRSLPIRISTGSAVGIQVRITAITAGGLVFRRGASLNLDEHGRPSPRSLPGKLLRSPGGDRSVREFPARLPGGVGP